MCYCSNQPADILKVDKEIDIAPINISEFSKFKISRTGFNLTFDIKFLMHQTNIVPDQTIISLSNYADLGKNLY